MVNEQFRNGEKVREGTIEVWEFDQQGNAAVQQEPFEIQPGDSFRTSCYYKDVGGGTTFGLGSQEEMCIVFMFYYPRKILFDTVPWLCGYGMPEFAQCNSGYEFQSLASDEALERSFGGLSDCEDTATEAPTSVDDEPSSGAQSSFKSLVTMVLFVGVFVVA